MFSDPLSLHNNTTSSSQWCVFTIDGSDDEEDNPLGAIIGVLVVLSDARLASLRLAATVAMQSLSLEVSYCILELLRLILASSLVDILGLMTEMAAVA